MKDASREAENMRDKFSTPWKLLPKPLRKTIVLIVGSTLIVTGILLIVLPGPFTIPLLILGLVVLAVEFAWAERLLIRVRHQGAKFNPKKLFRRQSGL
jgi:hypothetical protein